MLPALSWVAAVAVRVWIPRHINHCRQRGPVSDNSWCPYESISRANANRCLLSNCSVHTTQFLLSVWDGVYTKGKKPYQCQPEWLHIHGFYPNPLDSSWLPLTRQHISVMASSHLLLFRHITVTPYISLFLIQISSWPLLWHCPRPNSHSHVYPLISPQHITVL